jgi:predicted DNA-binding transcriptional regulator
MINELLAKIGLNEKEIQVYLTVLQNGKISPTALSKALGINRTTVYSVAKELVEKGLIREDLTSPTISLIARPAEDLEGYIDQEEKQIRQKRELAKRAIHELQSVVKTQTFALPKIIFVPEAELESYLYKQTPVWDKSILKYDGIWWGFQDDTLVGNYEKWIDWYWETGSDPKTKLKLLSNEVAENIKKKKFERRQIKFWDQSKNFTATTWVLGDFVTMIVTNQKPHYLVEIHDAVLAHNMREVFKGIWNTMGSNY